MDQLISLKNRDARRFNEIEWTILGWQDRRELDDTGTRGKGSNKKEDISKNNTIIGVVYVGVLVIFLLAYLA